MKDNSNPEKHGASLATPQLMVVDLWAAAALLESSKAGSLGVGPYLELVL
jgi:hypothetical protein